VQTAPAVSRDDEAVTLFLLLVLVAVALGIVGVAAKGLIYLLVIGIIVFLLAFVLLGRGLGRSRRQRPAR
jgi:hypothetical protein